MELKPKDRVDLTERINGDVLPAAVVVGWEMRMMRCEVVRVNVRARTCF